MRILSIALLLGVCAAPARALTLDSWTTPFPPNSCLPVTQQPILFTGPYCDGTTCPPDPFAPCWNPVAEQFNQPGYPPGFYRRAGLTSFQNQAASVRIAGGRLIVDSSESSDQYFQIYYLKEGQPDLDFVALGVESFRFDFQGTMSEAHPMWFQVLVFDGVGGVGEGIARITSGGTVTIPLPSFTLINSFSFQKVHYYYFSIFDCSPEKEVCPGPNGPISYSIGPLEFVATPTPAASTSWGHVKSLYR